MKLTSQLLKKNAVLYRIKRYPGSALLSLGLVIAFTFLICYCLGKVYPELKLFDNLLPKEAIKYRFYTGGPGGSYYAIGKTIEGKFTRTGDSVFNYQTKGGYENAMNVIIQKNSFGLIQEEIIKPNDPLRKNVRFITPLFLERMHIFYRKELFNTYSGSVQLSSNTDTSILRRLSDSVKIINPGPVGSGTRILASYVLTLIGRQINERIETFPKYKQTDLPPMRAFKKMLDCNTKKDSLIDIMFYVAADPVEIIKKVLDTGKYALMSIDPSLVVDLNKEFNLSLRIADFKEKYVKTNQISTIGTLAYLISSKTVRDDVVLSFLHKIETSKAAIHSQLIKDTAAFTSPLDEFGFFNSFSDDFNALKKFKWKELMAFAISVLTLFFPAFKSVSSIKSVLKSWAINKQIDDVVKMSEHASGETQHVTRYQVFEILSGIKERLIDLYGDDILPEGRFNALMRRINLYLEKFPGISPEIESPRYRA